MNKRLNINVLYKLRLFTETELEQFNQSNKQMKIDTCIAGGLGYCQIDVSNAATREENLPFMHRCSENDSIAVS